jgi:hypothetical protein
VAGAFQITTSEFEGSQIPTLRNNDGEEREKQDAENEEEYNNFFDEVIDV